MKHGLDTVLRGFRPTVKVTSEARLETACRSTPTSLPSYRQGETLSPPSQSVFGHHCPFSVLGLMAASAFPQSSFHVWLRVDRSCGATGVASTGDCWRIVRHRLVDHG